MGGITDILFGGDEPEGGGFEVGQPIDEFSGAQSEARDAISQLVTQLSTEGATGFGGDRVADPSELLSSLFGIAGGAAGQGGLIGQSLAGLESATTPQSAEELQKFFQTAFVDPSLSNFQQNIIPGIQSSFSAQNAGDSGALNRALAGAGADVSQDLSSQLAKLIFSTQQAGLNRSLSASQFGLGTGLGLLGSTAGAQQGLEQAELDATFSEFLRTSPEAILGNQGLTSGAVNIPAFNTPVQGIPFQQDEGIFGSLATAAQTAALFI